MPRIHLLDRDAVPGEASSLMGEIHQAFGIVPNMFRAVANSEASLRSLWAAFGALNDGVIGSRLGEQIAVAIANRNGCRYCLSAHMALGKKAGVSDEDMAQAQIGRSSNPRTQAALTFALKLVEHRGHLVTADVEALKAAGFSDGESVEILAHVALNLFTNYLNVAFDVPLDFPVVALRMPPR